MWENLESIFGDGTSSNKENEKKSNKNKGLQKQEAQPQESHSSCAHDLVDDEKRSKNLEPKGIHTNYYFFSYNFDDSNLNHVEEHNKDEDNVKTLRVEISKLTTTCKDQEKLLQISDDKEAKLKEEIVSLKIKLEKS